jgi:DNA-binding MarR family transcriptional regulator
MNIEQAIHTSRFSGEDHKLAINLMFTGSWFDALASKHFNQFGITTQQHNVLRILRGSHPNTLNVGTLQSRMVDKSSNVTRLVLKLREKGYVVQTTNANNRRVQEIRITPLGLELVAQIETQQHEILAHVNHLTPEEQTLLNLLLDKLRTKSA